MTISDESIDAVVLLFLEATNSEHQADFNDPYYKEFIRPLHKYIYDSGFNTGLNEGFQNGHETGFTEGYNQGVKDNE